LLGSGCSGPFKDFAQGESAVAVCGQIDQIDIAAGSAEHLGDGSGFSVLSPQQLRQLRDVGGDALGFVAHWWLKTAVSSTLVSKGSLTTKYRRRISCHTRSQSVEIAFNHLGTLRCPQR
jgi:hypothetical protein